MVKFTLSGAFIASYYGRSVASGNQVSHFIGDESLNRGCVAWADHRLKNDVVCFVEGYYLSYILQGANVFFSLKFQVVGWVKKASNFSIGFVQLNGIGNGSCRLIPGYNKIVVSVGPAIENTRNPGCQFVGKSGKQKSNNCPGKNKKSTASQIRGQKNR